MTAEVAMDLESLLPIRELMKERNEDHLDTFQKQQLIKETSELLRNDIVMKLINSIRSTVDFLFRETASPSSEVIDSDLNALRTKAEILFFIFYKSQIVKKEAVALLELIRHMSNLILPSDGDYGNFTTEAEVLRAESRKEYKVPACSLVVILQLAHVCSLQQTSYLFSREVDYSGIRSVDSLPLGNALENQAESREGMDSSFWACSGAKGLACLALAVFRQPEVDANTAPPADVEWFLFEACRSRAYSYIRLCVIPVLQIAYLQGKRSTKSISIHKWPYHFIRSIMCQSHSFFHHL
jgi:uncharacterized protein YjgD (DUF1641 family)